jgi:hypothetical protein
VSTDSALPLRVPSCTSPSDIEHARGFIRQTKSCTRALYRASSQCRSVVLSGAMPSFVTKDNVSASTSQYHKRESCSVNRPNRKRKTYFSAITGSLLHSRIASVFVLLRRRDCVSVQTSRSLLENRSVDLKRDLNVSRTHAFSCVASVDALQQKELCASHLMQNVVRVCF